MFKVVYILPSVIARYGDLCYVVYLCLRCKSFKHFLF